MAGAVFKLVFIFVVFFPVTFIDPCCGMVLFNYTKTLLQCSVFATILISQLLYKKLVFFIHNDIKQECHVSDCYFCVPRSQSHKLLYINIWYQISFAVNVCCFIHYCLTLFSSDFMYWLLIYSNHFSTKSSLSSNRKYIFSTKARVAFIIL